MLLDAATIDVYKQTHCAILMYDPAKRWTFDYVGRALEQIPDDIPVLVLVRGRLACSAWGLARTRL